MRIGKALKTTAMALILALTLQIMPMIAVESPRPMTNFLRTAKTEIDGEAPGIRQWAKDLSAAMKRLKMDPKFASRRCV